jgi:hypothetical protein
MLEQTVDKQWEEFQEDRRNTTTRFFRKINIFGEEIEDVAHFYEAIFYILLCK